MKKKIAKTLGESFYFFDWFFRCCAISRNFLREESSTWYQDVISSSWWKQLEHTWSSPKEQSWTQKLLSTRYHPLKMIECSVYLFTTDTKTRSERCVQIVRDVMCLREFLVEMEQKHSDEGISEKGLFLCW